MKIERPSLYKTVATLSDLPYSRREFLKGCVAVGALSSLGIMLPIGSAEAADIPAPKPGPLPAQTGGKKYEGMVLTVSTLAGPVGKPMKLFKGEWEKATGAHVTLVEFPFGDIHAKYKAAFATGTHVADIMDFGSDFDGDIMGGGHLRPVPSWVRDRLDWSDVLKPYRERILYWGDTEYAVPYDGDTTSLFYRKDIIADADVRKRFEDKMGKPLTAPKSWDEAKEVAKFFTGWDWNKRGSNSYGIALQAKPNDSQYFFFPALAAPFVKIHGVTDGIYFDTENFSPLINNEGWIAALELWKEMTSYAPPAVLNSGFAEVRAQFVGRDAFMAMDWADMGTLSYNPKQSQVVGKVGFSLVPGVERVFDYKTGNWKKLKGINVAPFLAWNGWATGVPKTTSDEKAEACFDFLTFMASKQISMKSVVTPDSGINPWRKFHVENVEAWVAGSPYQKKNGIPYGFPTKEDAEGYLNTLRSVYDNPNVVPDLRVPGAFDYFNALDQNVTLVVAGEMSAKKGLDKAAKDFDRITKSLGGHKKQLRYYRASLGM